MQAGLKFAKFIKPNGELPTEIRGRRLERRSCHLEKVCLFDKFHVYKPVRARRVQIPCTKNDTGEGEFRINPRR